MITQKKGGEWSFEGLCLCEWVSGYLLLSRKLEGVIAKLEPLSDQHVLASFLHNIDNAKTLVGFVQELADAIIDYQV